MDRAGTDRAPARAVPGGRAAGGGTPTPRAPAGPAAGCEVLVEVERDKRPRR